MSAVTVEDILHQVEQLPLTEQRRLRLLLNEMPLSVPDREPRDKRLPAEPWPEAQAAMNWLLEHAHEYRGQWVALAGDRLIAHGTDRSAVRAAHQAAGFDASQVLLHRIAAPDEPPFAGV